MKRDERITITVTPEEKAKIQMDADKIGMTLSAYIRYFLISKKEG